MTKRLIASLVAPIAMLAACGEEPVVETSDDEGRTAKGEVLGGTISDDMLPLDRVQSQSPPLREEPAASAGGSTSAVAIEDDAATQTSPTAEPAASEAPATPSES